MSTDAPAPTIVAVPAAVDMTDANFVRHVHRRHAKDFPRWGGKFSPEPSDDVLQHEKWLATWVPAWRAFHEQMHKLQPFGPYDHEHNLPRSTQ